MILLQHWFVLCILNIILWKKKFHKNEENSSSLFDDHTIQGTDDRDKQEEDDNLEN